MNAALEAVTVDNELQPFETAAVELGTQVERANVIDADSAARMTDLIKIAKAQYARAEDARKKLTGPLNQHIKWINGQFKPATDALKVIERDGKAKLGAWQREEEARQRAEAEAARKKAEDEALAAAERAHADGDESAAEVALNRAANVPEAPKAAPTRGQYGGSSSLRRIWRAEITNLPEFLRAVAAGRAPIERVSINNAALHRLAVQTRGPSPIPGVRFLEDVTVQVR
jgi:hypothetical protein